MNPSKDIVVPVTLDERTFRHFAFYDAFVLKRRWMRPVLFSAIMAAFAFAALLLRREQSGLIAAVLLTVGAGLPIIYLGTFLSQVNLQAARSALSRGRQVYTVTLRDSEVCVKNDQRREDELRVAWKDCFMACRRPGCIYLYVAPQKAFLLPVDKAKASDAAIWPFITARMGAERCRG